ncbi:hypothetical protein REPUB_Repub14bG0069000 [Reevesia pubescens]
MGDLEICLEEEDRKNLVWSMFFAIGKIVVEKVLNKRGVLAILRGIWLILVTPLVRAAPRRNLVGVSIRNNQRRSTTDESKDFHGDGLFHQAEEEVVAVRGEGSKHVDEESYMHLEEKGSRHLEE